MAQFEALLAVSPSPVEARRRFLADLKMGPTDVAERTGNSKGTVEAVLSGYRGGEAAAKARRDIAELVKVPESEFFPEAA